MLKLQAITCSLYTLSFLDVSDVKHRQRLQGCARYGIGIVGTGIDVVPNLPKCPVPVLMYQTYRSVRYRYESLYRYKQYRYPYRTELTEVSDTSNTGCMPRYVPYRTHPC